MPIQLPPDRGEVLIGDFNGLRFHEMEKIRPCVVISPRIASRSDLATVVCLSTTAPDKVEDYHALLTFEPIFCKRFPSPTMWIKGDMVYSISITRLSRQRDRSSGGARNYPIRKLSKEDLTIVIRCVLNGIGYKVDENLNRL